MFNTSTNWRQSIFCWCTRAWNRLPTELKLLRSTDSFRCDLKTFLFHSVYGHQHTDWLCDALSVF